MAPSIQDYVVKPHPPYLADRVLELTCALLFLQASATLSSCHGPRPLAVED